MIIQGTHAARVSDLRSGDDAALFADCSALQRIRFAEDLGRGRVRVEWDHGPGTRATVRIMPAANSVQIAERSR